MMVILLVFQLSSVLVFAQKSDDSTTVTWRYAYAISDPGRIPTLAKTNPNKPCFKTLDEIGIEKFEIYTNSELAFIIMDTKTSTSYDQIINKLKTCQGSNLGLSLNDLVNQQGYHLTKRIFNMSLREETKTGQGQISEVPTEYARTVLTLEIVNDPVKREQYIDLHKKDKFWPQIIKNMKTVGIYNMELYLSGYQAYLIIDTRKDFDFDKDGAKWSALPREKEWQELVSYFQKVDSNGNSVNKWQPMTEIFRLTKP